MKILTLAFSSTILFYISSRSVWEMKLRHFGQTYLVKFHLRWTKTFVQNALRFHTTKSDMSIAHTRLISFVSMYVLKSEIGKVFSDNKPSWPNPIMRQFRKVFEPVMKREITSHSFILTLKNTLFSPLVGLEISQQQPLYIHC